MSAAQRFLHLTVLALLIFVTEDGKRGALTAAGQSTQQPYQLTRSTILLFASQKSSQDLRIILSFTHIRYAPLLLQTPLLLTWRFMVANAVTSGEKESPF
jgi:hypothetical protein